MSQPLESDITEQVPRKVLLVALAQLGVAGAGVVLVLSLAVQNGFSADSSWALLPLPLMLTALGAVTVWSIRRRRIGAAMVTVGSVPISMALTGWYAAHGRYDYQRNTYRLEFGDWVSGTFLHPMGQWVMTEPYPVRARIADYACLVSAVLTVVVVILLAGRVGRSRLYPSPRPTLVLVGFSLAAFGLPELAEPYTNHQAMAPDVSIGAVAVAAVVVLLLDLVARPGAAMVVKTCTVIGGAVLLVPLVWQLWVWRPWQWWIDYERVGTHVGVQGYSRILQWEGVADAVTALGWLVGLLSVALAAATGAGRIGSGLRSSADDLWPIRRV